MEEKTTLAQEHEVPHPAAASTETTLPSPATRRVDLKRAKDDSRRLARWTGEPLTTCHEITARAFGATSWQALRKNPVFIPDESLLDKESDERLPLSRYKELGHLLSERLDCCETLGRVIAAYWRPTAVTATPYLLLQADSMFRHMERSELLDDVVTEAKGAEADAYLLHLLPIPENWAALLPEGFTMAIVAQRLKPTRTLVGVKPGRLALYMRWSDCVPVINFLDLHTKVYTAKDRSFLPPDDVSRLHRVMWPRVEFRSAADARHRVPLKPVKVTARWLKTPMTVTEITAVFVQLMPWTADRYLTPDAQPISSYAIQLGQVRVEFYHHNEGWSPSESLMTVRVTDPARTRFGKSTGHGLDSFCFRHSDEAVVDHFLGRNCSVPAGALGINWHPSGRTVRELPSLSREDYEKLVLETGLGPRAVVLERPGLRPVLQQHRFYESNAGLAHAAWVASRSEDQIQAIVDQHSFLAYPELEALDRAYARMIWELARAHRID